MKTQANGKFEKLMQQRIKKRFQFIMKSNKKNVIDDVQMLSDDLLLSSK